MLELTSEFTYCNDLVLPRVRNDPNNDNNYHMRERESLINIILASVCEMQYHLPGGRG